MRERLLGYWALSWVGLIGNIIALPIIALIISYGPPLKIANKTCDCYYEEFMQTASHQDAKTKCKLETKENLNHNKKI